MATSKNTSALDRRFGYTAKGSSFKTECLAGLTTFFAMAYILMVNAGMFEYSARDCAARPLKLSIHSGGIEHACRRR